MKKSFIHDMSVKGKLMLILMTVAIGVGGVMALAFVVNDIATMRRSIFDDLSGTAAVLGENCSAAIAFHDDRAAAETLSALRAKPWVVEAWLYLPDSSVFAEYLQDKSDLCKYPCAAPPEIPEEETFFSDRGHAHLIQPVLLDGERVATIHLVSDLAELSAKLKDRLLIGGGIILLALSAATIFSILLQKVVSGPILHLTETMAAVKKGNDYSLRAERSSNDELGTLVDGFNDMLEQIEAHSEERLRYSEQLEEKVAARTEKLRLAMEEAQAANHAKSQFLANMSHEIRTPINGVYGMLQLLKGTESEERQRQCVETATIAIKTLLTVVNDVLDFSKIDAGKLELDVVEFSLRDVVEDAVQFFSEPAADKKIELAQCIETDVPAAARGDDRRIAQILMNLLGNAIKFTEEGDVLLKVELAGETGQGPRIRFSIHDTGIGVPQDQQEKLFKPFSQADGSMTRKYGGSGLGLAICVQLVELMGGEIGMDSVDGEGSTFWFELPLGKQDANMLPEPDTLDGLRVLLVDDNDMARKAMFKELEELGCCVEAHSSAESAFAFAREAYANGIPFDYLLIDEAMPETSGSEFGARVMEDPDLCNTRMGMLCQNAGRCSWTTRMCLQKPVRRKRLISVLKGSRDVSMGEEEMLDFNQADEGSKSEICILIAEDNEINQMVVEEMLTVFGYQYDCVGNGREALEAVKTGQYDLVLMDCQMPDMDGYDSTRAIREWESRKGGEPSGIPIIALTAHAMKGDNDRCIESGMNDYLAKPVEQDELRHLIRKWTKAVSA